MSPASEFIFLSFPLFSKLYWLIGLNFWDHIFCSWHWTCLISPWDMPGLFFDFNVKSTPWYKWCLPFIWFPNNPNIIYWDTNSQSNFIFYVIFISLSPTLMLNICRLWEAQAIEGTEDDKIYIHAFIIVNLPSFFGYSWIKNLQDWALYLQFWGLWHIGTSLWISGNNICMH